MMHFLRSDPNDKGPHEGVQAKTLEFRPDGRWLVAARLLLLWAALSSLTYSTFFTSSELAERVGFLFHPLAILFGFSAISAVLLRWFAERQGFFLGQLFIDMLLLTGIVYITGGPASPFLFLYLPLVMVAAVFLTRLHALTVALACACSYVGLAFVMYQKIISPADGSNFVHVPVGGIVLQCVGLASALVLVAVATSFLRKNMKLGFQLAERSAADLNKISKEQDKLRTYVKEIEEQVALQERMADLLSEPEEHTEIAFENFVGKTKIMEQVFRLIERVARSQATVLISGESGTGKELVAKAVHEKSERVGRPFIAVNCGAIPENLIESELFGHRKGSFTGADSDHTGLFRKADRGTLFLDEIGELPLLMQAKLLRVIQDRCVRPVGADTGIQIDVRIIAATNRNLSKEVKEGRFREDLYYRLNVIHVQLPALRERKDDIPLLVRSVISKLKGQNADVHITPSALRALVHYSYPGNVRELENIIERALVFGGDVIRVEHLPEVMTGHPTLFSQETVVVEGSEIPEQSVLTKNNTEIVNFDGDIEFPVQLDEILNTIERRYLEMALHETAGVKKKAASLLGMNFRSFRYRLQKFGMAQDRD